MIDAEGLALIYSTDSVDDEFNYLTRELTEYSLETPGATL